jgi:hypothetical protein
LKTLTGLVPKENTMSTKKTASKKPTAQKPASSSDKLTYQQRMSKLKPAERIDSKLANTTKRLGGILRAVRNWAAAGQPGIAEHVTAAVAAVSAARDVIRALPADFVPARSTAPKKTLAENTHVKIRDKRRESYADIVDAKLMDDLVVTGVAKGKVKLSTPAGVYVGFFPRAHVEELA